MADYKQLAVWQRAHQFTFDIYKITRGFPQSELFGLVSQMRRSAVSIGFQPSRGTWQRRRFRVSSLYSDCTGLGFRD